MDFKFSATRLFLRTAALLSIVVLAFYGCKEEKDEPLPPEPEPNNPPVALISINPSSGERPLEEQLEWIILRIF